MHTLPPLENLIILTERPGQMYIDHDGKLYVSTEDRTVIMYEGMNFSMLTEDEIKEYIQDPFAG